MDLLGSLSFVRNSTTSCDDRVAMGFLCRIFADSVKRVWTSRPSGERIDIGERFVGKRNADADCHADCFFAANAE